MSMVEPGCSDGTSFAVPSVGDIMTFLDFPMESLEGEDELGGDWDESKSQSFGPIPSEALMDLLPVPGGNLRNALNVPLKPNVPTCSPVSVLENGGSCSGGKSLPIKPEIIIPVRTRSKRARASVLNPWFVMTPISPAASEAKRRRKEKFSPASLGLDDSFKLGKEQPLHAPCTHCRVTTTPQWREGPMGPKTLCNACGVRYRSGRLFPEYRPLASPTFVPTLHSNCHRKVVEMRKKAPVPEADVILEVPMAQAQEFIPTQQPNVGRNDVGMREKAVLQEMDILYDAPMLEATEFVPTLHSNSCGKYVGMRKEAINQEVGVIHDTSMTTAPELAAALHSNPRSNYVGMRKKAIMQEMDMIHDAPVSAASEFATMKHSNSGGKGPGMRKKPVAHERDMTHDAPTPPTTQFVPRMRNKAIMKEVDMIRDAPMSPAPEFVPMSSYLFDFIY